ncbi:enoyl-CoA hydratase/isomerase family protein [Chengkuizengella axinellae]|uniref:Enoyl-CoA hydratase/isomerase family protein n=1 Tax=Chengkuizengella axinellae TaxID=3064388 RepID=A0ABT9IZZ7_9BACL|nr:enoyl-CoA hydratase/isomerase family protein [Chengkuizengella sp. 2205SS18-9]MDP5274895.1 enoyl-CoA hydratase/isomerase family protein [Chengkuizengella sp. 2205SS18-9]
MDTKSLTIKKETGFTTVLINHGEVNLLTNELILELQQVVAELNKDELNRAVIFRSSNPHFFSAHLDVTVINRREEGITGTANFMQLIDDVKNMNAITFAIVDGAARGGGNEFAMACDIVYGTENAVFAQPEISTNIPPGGQGSVQAARRLGRTRALEFLLTSADMDAPTAERFGLITRHVPSASLEQTLQQIVTPITFLEQRDIDMMKEIVDLAIKDEKAAIELEKKRFIERSGEDKTQYLIGKVLKHGAQTSREIHISELLADVAADVMQDMAQMKQ